MLKDETILMPVLHLAYKHILGTPYVDCRWFKQMKDKLVYAYDFSAAAISSEY